MPTWVTPCSASQARSFPSSCVVVPKVRSSFRGPHPGGPRRTQHTTLAPLANLELYSVAPAVTRELYRLLGANAGRHAKGGTPAPARNPYTDEAIEARYHTTVIALMALERAWVKPGAEPEELSQEGLR